MSLTKVEEVAPAKINLALHVTGQRDDGYHLLDSLVTFADQGDALTFSRSEQDQLTISGRFAAGLPLDNDPKTGNLVLKARDLLRSDLSMRGIKTPPVHIHLEKNLPLASGIGGGSADAAATLRGLSKLWGHGLSAEAEAQLAMSLGADLPMCLYGKPLIARGIGEELTPLLTLPGFSLVLANPLQQVSTPAVFKLLEEKNNPPMHIADSLSGLNDWLASLRSLRNDLEPPARQVLSDIAVISSMLFDAGALLVRMSGSGATCFGIFDDDRANAASKELCSLRPDWYFHAVKTIAGDAS